MHLWERCKGDCYMKISRKTQGCYGCKCCQIICGFHHTGTFDPSASSIQVRRNYVTGVISWTIDTSCDNCAGEAEPLCVKYCTYGIIGSDNKKADDDASEGGAA